jgi:hypothetical protein
MRDFSGISLFLAGTVFGAGLMYLLDPRGGSRRRALIRDKFVRGNRMARMYGGKIARHLRSEVRGELEEHRAKLRERGVMIPDDVLVERVRSQIGHVVSHPGSIDVIAENGIIRLRGPVLRGEIDKICDRLGETRGVHDYRIELQEFESAEDIPGLQGESRSQRERRWAG